MSDIERISSHDYSPTEQDILRSRVKTTGILETKFKAGGLSITLIDVGGQRNERRKWIHCFENVTSLMFVVGLTEYNQMLLEDPNVNRLQESIQVFDSVINSRWFLKSTIIFFMNKTDLFKDRLRRFPLENYYKDYANGFDPSKAAKYIYLLFQDVNRQKLKIYPHYTNACDTKAMKSVFNAINDTYAHKYLKGNGLL
jgi:guanine nucleotide-binding protein G(i) subunit alpha